MKSKKNQLYRLIITQKRKFLNSFSLKKLDKSFFMQYNISVVQKMLV